MMSRNHQIDLETLLLLRNTDNLLSVPPELDEIEPSIAKSPEIAGQP